MSWRENRPIIGSLERCSLSLEYPLTSSARAREESLKIRKIIFSDYASNLRIKARWFSHTNRGHSN